MGFFDNVGATPERSIKKWLLENFDFGALVDNLSNSECEKYFHIDPNTLDIELFHRIKLLNKEIEEFPNYIHFSVSRGSFDVSSTKIKSFKGFPKKIIANLFANGCKITSFEGAPQTIEGCMLVNNNHITDFTGFPKYVGHDAEICGNNIKSLEGFPQDIEIHGMLSVGNNKLTSLKGCPTIIGSLDCSENKLITLEGCPEQLTDFKCSKNKTLTNLVGGPKVVTRTYDCQSCGLTSLEGAPEGVGDHFLCQRNKLTTLEGSPKEVGGKFNVSHNNLTSLKGSPIKVTGYVSITYNPIECLDSDFKYINKSVYCSDTNITSMEIERYLKSSGLRIGGNIINTKDLF